MRRILKVELKAWNTSIPTTAKWNQNTFWIYLPLIGIIFIKFRIEKQFSLLAKLSFLFLILRIPSTSWPPWRRGWAWRDPRLPLNTTETTSWPTIIANRGWPRQHRPRKSQPHLRLSQKRLPTKPSRPQRGWRHGSAGRIMIPWKQQLMGKSSKWEPLL